jgi:hypothetical protein
MSLTPGDTLLTPKDATECGPTDAKFISVAYTSVSANTDYNRILPIIDCGNGRNFAVAITNNSSQVSDNLYVVFLGSTDELMTTPPPVTCQLRKCPMPEH